MATSKCEDTSDGTKLNMDDILKFIEEKYLLVPKRTVTDTSTASLTSSSIAKPQPDMNMKQLVVVLLVVFVHRTFGIDITFDPAKPALGDSVTISCKRSSSSGQSVLWNLDSILLTTCDGSTDNICIPNPTGHVYSTDVSAGIFNLSLASVALTDCKTYTCTDAVTSSDTDSKDLSIAKCDSSEIVLTEPVALSSGTMSLTTGCVLSPLMLLFLGRK